MTTVKYCYSFEKEVMDTQKVKDIFGSKEEMNKTAEDAWEELKWEQNENPEYFKQKEAELGKAKVIAVVFNGNEVVETYEVKIN